MYGSEEGGEASFSLYDNTEQEDADWAGGEEEIQQEVQILPLVMLLLEETQQRTIMLLLDMLL